MKIYVKSMAQISSLRPDPDYSGMFSMMESRRLTKLMKRALSLSSDALNAAGVANPDAIITGSGLGCIANTQQFLSALRSNGELPLKPTHFMQSTHNTISSLIGIRLKCHGYNATYSHSNTSFESALLDAVMQFELGNISNALVGEFDETTAELSSEMTETAVSTVLSSDAEGALCRLEDVQLSSSPFACPEGSFVLKREDYVQKYGENPGVSALGFCDAVEMIVDNKAERVIVLNGGANFNSKITLCKA